MENPFRRIVFVLCFYSIEMYNNTSYFQLANVNKLIMTTCVIYELYFALTSVEAHFSPPLVVMHALFSKLKYCVYPMNYTRMKK